MSLKEYKIDGSELLRMVQDRWIEEHPDREMRGVWVRIHFAPFTGEMGATVITGPVAEVVLARMKERSET